MENAVLFRGGFTVPGIGTKEVDYDRVKITFTVTGRGATARAARDEADPKIKAAEALYDELKERHALQLDGRFFSKMPLTPVRESSYDNKSGEHVFKGYRFQWRLTFAFANVEPAAEVQDAFTLSELGEAAAPEFFLTKEAQDRSEAEIEALAMEDAEARMRRRIALAKINSENVFRNGFTFDGDNPRADHGPGYEYEGVRAASAMMDAPSGGGQGRPVSVQVGKVALARSVRVHYLLRNPVGIPSDPDPNKA